MSDSETRRAREAFEYMFMELPYSLEHHVFLIQAELDELNRLGAEGWQVVMSIPREPDMRGRPMGYVLMRRKE